MIGLGTCLLVVWRPLTNILCIFRTTTSSPILVYKKYTEHGWEKLTMTFDCCSKSMETQVGTNNLAFCSGRHAPIIFLNTRNRSLIYMQREHFPYILLAMVHIQIFRNITWHSPIEMTRLIDYRWAASCNTSLLRSFSCSIHLSLIVSCVQFVHYFYVRMLF